MRFVSLLGLLVFLGIAFLMSNNRSKIRPRIILWGVSLQLLLAAIILGNPMISFTGMFLFLSLLILYIFKDSINEKSSRSAQLIHAGIVLIAMGAAAGIFYFVDSLGFLTLLLTIVVLAIFILSFIGKTQYQRYLAASFLTMGWVYNVANGIDGKTAFKFLSAKVDTFLRLSDLGSAFLFGNLVDPKYYDTFGFQFAFAVLPTIIFFAAFLSILYHIFLLYLIVFYNLISYSNNHRRLILCSFPFYRFNKLILIDLLKLLCYII